MATSKLCQDIDVVYKKHSATMVNPLTGRTIKVNGQTFKSLARGCRYCERKDNPCGSLRKNPRRNPFTGKALAPKSRVAALLASGCDSCDDLSRKTKNLKRAQVKISTAIKKGVARRALAKGVANWRKRREATVISSDSEGPTPPPPPKRPKAAAASKKKKKKTAPKRKPVWSHFPSKEEYVEQRKKALTKNAGQEWLYAGEIEYLLKHFMFYGGDVPRNVKGRVINVSTTEMGAYGLVGMKDGEIAVVGDGTHFGAIQVHRRGNGVIHVDYYEPFSAPYNPMVTILNRIVVAANDGADNGRFTRYQLGWQSSSGPCGIYASYAARYLAENVDLKDAKVSKHHKPSMGLIKDVYKWLGDNVEHIDV